MAGFDAFGPSAVLRVLAVPCAVFLGAGGAARLRRYRCFAAAAQALFFAFWACKGWFFRRRWCDGRSGRRRFLGWDGSCPFALAFVAGSGFALGYEYGIDKEKSCGFVLCIPVEQAQELLRVVSDAPSSALYGGIDVDALKGTAEEVLLRQFKGVSDAFGSRDNLLTEKAKQAVHSHAQRQISRNERQLQREDLNINLRNMYLGWNRRINDETTSKLAEINQKGGVRSSLETIGAAIIRPDGF